VRDTKDSAQEKVLENQSDKAISSMGWSELDEDAVVAGDNNNTAEV
jgi:hypothetical protein